MRSSGNPDLSEKKCEAVEGHLMADHGHMTMSIPPNYPATLVSTFFESSLQCPVDNARMLIYILFPKLKFSESRLQEE